MDLEDKFFEEMKKWKGHCESHSVQFDSTNKTLRECGAYKELVKMGEDILPFISRLYNVYNASEPERDELGIKEDLTLIMHGLPMLIKEIVPDKYQIPEHIKGKVRDRIIHYTSEWLLNYLGSEKNNGNLDN